MEEGDVKNLQLINGMIQWLPPKSWTVGLPVMFLPFHLYLLGDGEGEDVSDDRQDLQEEEEKVLSLSLFARSTICEESLELD